MRRIALLLGAAACFVAAGFLAPVSAEDTPGSGFFGYALTAQSQALQLTEDEPSANSHPEAETDLPHSQVSLTSGPVGYGLSSVAWPGALLGNAGSLVLLVQPSAPSQVSSLNDPVRAEARTGSASHSSTNDSVPGAHMEADATPARTTASALLDGGTAGATLGFGRSSSASTSVLGTSTGRVTADSTAKDVVLAGVVRIGSVVSHAEATTDGAVASAKGTTTVHDMTVAGIPVVVDDHGVTVASQHGDLPPTAQDTVNSALSSLGMTIALSRPTSSRTGGTISYDAGSLTVLWKPPGSANTFTAGLGGSRVLAAASRSASFLPLPLPGGLPPVVAPAQPVAAQPASAGAPQLPAGQPPVRPAVSAPRTAPLEPVTAALSGVASGTPAPTWTVLLTLLGAALLLAGLWRVPGLVLLEPRPTRCPLEEDA